MKRRRTLFDDLDPRTPEVEALIRGKAPAEELAARLALNGLCTKCRTDRVWRARIEELQAEIAPDEAKLAKVITRAREIERSLKEQMGG